MNSLLEKLKIGVICGGFSREREVSLRSGKNVYDSLVRQGYNVVQLDPVSDDITAILFGYFLKGFFDCSSKRPLL